MNVDHMAVRTVDPITVIHGLMSSIKASELPFSQLLLALTLNFTLALPLDLLELPASSTLVRRRSFLSVACLYVQVIGDVGTTGLTSFLTIFASFFILQRVKPKLTTPIERYPGYKYGKKQPKTKKKGGFFSWLRGASRGKASHSGSVSHKQRIEYGTPVSNSNTRPWETFSAMRASSGYGDY
jgi:hypothetical protein